MCQAITSIFYFFLETMFLIIGVGLVVCSEDRAWGVMFHCCIKNAGSQLLLSWSGKADEMSKAEPCLAGYS